MDYEVNTYCPVCQEWHKVVVKFDDLMAWKNGEPIEKAMPYLTASEREMLISGICAECWAKIFA